MRVRVPAIALLLALTTAACGGDSTGPDPDDTPIRISGMPSGWKGYSNATGYQLGIDSTQHHGGRAAVFFHTSAATATQYTYIFQSIRADAFRGKRIRLSGWLRTRDVVDGTGLWMRVDGPVFLQAYDDMRPRRVLGTTSWKQYAVVLNVPADAVGISFGVLLNGNGDVLADDLELEVVDTTVPSTALTVGFVPTFVGDYNAAPTAPMNLAFEDGLGSN